MGGGGRKERRGMLIIEHPRSAFDFVYINIAASKRRGLEIGQEEVTVARS